MPTNTKQGIFLKLNYNSQMHSEINFPCTTQGIGISIRQIKF